MSALRFHHVFFLLMLLALVSAFTLSPERSAKLTPQIQTFFVPISKPAASLGRLIDARMHPAPKVNSGSAEELAEQNRNLQVAVASLTAQLEELKILNRDRERLGDLRKVSKTYAVIAGDAGSRQTLQIGGSTLEGLQVDQPVIVLGGLVGRITQSGVAGAKVTLITDPSAVPLTAVFRRFMQDESKRPILVNVDTGKFASVPVQGAGNNSLVVDVLTMDDARDVQLRDIVVLADPLWPENLQGYTIGTVVAKEPRRESPLFAKITIQPTQDLKRLKDVNVVVK